MARVASLVGQARKLCAERGRRGSRKQPLEPLGILLAVIGSVRFLANVYLAALLGPHLGAESGERYLLASAWLLLCFLCTAGCARAYRTTNVLLAHPRFRLAPVKRGRLIATIARIALVRPETIALAALLAVSLAASLAVWGPASVPALELLSLLVVGCAAFAGCYAALGLWGMGDRALGYLEPIFMLALIYANPDVRIQDGRLCLLLLGDAIRAPSSLATASLSLVALPLALGICGAAAHVVRALRRRRASTRERRSVDPMVRLYRADLPLGIFVASYIVEGALVMGSSIPAPSLRGLSLLLLALRLGWYALLVLRTEYRVAGWRPAPVLAPRARAREFARTAPFHALLCLLPVLFHVARELL